MVLRFKLKKFRINSDGKEWFRLDVHEGLTWREAMAIILISMKCKDIAWQIIKEEKKDE